MCFAYSVLTVNEKIREGLQRYLTRNYSCCRPINDPHANEFVFNRSNIGPFLIYEQAKQVRVRIRVWVRVIYYICISVAHISRKRPNTSQCFAYKVNSLKRTLSGPTLLSALESFPP